MRLKATSFATRQDLAHFAKAVTNGLTVQQAFNYGDNGIGAWGDKTWILYPVTPIVALPKGIGEHQTKCKVTLQDKTVTCICLDRSPEGVCDLAPSALLAFGLNPDTDLDETCEVTIIE